MSNTLNICQITSMHDWDDDRIYQRNCLGLAQAGHNVVYIAQGERSPDDNISHITLRVRSGFKRRILGTFEAFKQSLKLKDYVLHIHDPEFLPYIFLYRLLGYKAVFDSHEVYSVRFYQWSKVPNFMRAGLADIYFWIEARVMNLFTALIVTSESMKEMYDKHNKKVVVIRNLHSLKVLENAATESKLGKWDQPIVYTSGVINADRNSDRMVRAFAQISEDYPHARLRFAGWYGPGYKNHLLSLSQDLGIADKVEFLGALPYLEQFKRTSEAAIGFIFLENTRKNRVASSNRLFEFMYCGLPIIVENTPECARVINDSQAGILVNSDSINEVVVQLSRLLSDRNLCEKLGANGKKAVRSFYHFEKDLGRLEELYTDITRR
jgi:glycosyltransferase involved in cell wall biosynthesis